MGKEYISEASIIREKLKRDPYYRSLLRNLVLNVFLISFTPMLLISGIILYQFNTSYKQKVYDYLEELVLKHKEKIDGFLNEKLGMVRFLATTFSYNQLANEELLDLCLMDLQKECGPFFVDLGVVDADGQQVSYAGPFNLRDVSYKEAEWFKAAKDKDYFISDVFLGLRGLPHFIVTVRKNRKGRDWILRATIDFMAFNRLVENLRVGKTGFAYILNRQGQFQTKPMVADSMSEQLYARIADNLADNGDHLRIFLDTGAGGVDNIYAVASLKNGDWYLVYQQSRNDAFRDLHHTMSLAALTMILGGVGIFTLVFFLSKRMVSYVAKANFEKETMDKQMVEASKMASIGELAAGIAHEINNPVAIMVEEAGWVEDLLDEEEFQEGENLEEFQRALAQIRTQGHRCKEITQKLLHFARKSDSRIQQVQINDIIEELVKLSEQRAKFSKILFTTDLSPNLPPLLASQSEMQQVLLNLINNSIGAMEREGGIIKISTWRETNHVRERDEVVVQVADTGPGIPEANVKRIFDPFFTTKPVGQGTGLGLSICYGIVRKMDGEIMVDSTVGMGAIFTIRLPLETMPSTVRQSGSREETA